MGTIEIVVAARTDVGRVRDHNEDAFATVELPSGAALADARVDGRDRRVLLALADGMGGHQAGEVASAMVLDELVASLRAAPEVSEHVVEAAVRRANTAVRAAARAEGREGMGATLTAVLIDRDRAWIAEVGDSRAYLLREGRLRQITHDQSFVQMLVDIGAISPDEARSSPQKNVILQAMGLKNDVRAAIGRLALRRGDRLLLCCDGLSNEIPDSELAVVLRDLAPGPACERLIAMANERGGADNLTAVIAHLDGAGLEPPRDRESITVTLDAIQDFGGASAPAPKSAAATTPAATTETTTAAATTEPTTAPTTAATTAPATAAETAPATAAPTSAPTAAPTSATSAAPGAAAPRSWTWLAVLIGLVVVAAGAIALLTIAR